MHIIFVSDEFCVVIPNFFNKKMRDFSFTKKIEVIIGCCLTVTTVSALFVFFHFTKFQKTGNNLLLKEIDLLTHDGH